jgi:hypothetical protein
LQANSGKYLPAFACALIPILCYLLIRPYAEMGIDDDGLYIKNALNFRFGTLDRHTGTESAA